MKKFFKALAVVLALTLVIGTIPASAAVSLELKGDGKKIIYIDGSKGTKADGTKCAVVNKYKLSKLVKNFDADTMDIKLSSADKSIATTSNNYDRVYAKGIGTTEVTITVLDLESEDQKKVLATLVETVQVKKNATKDSFVVISDEIVDGAKVGVNTEYTVKMPRVQNGVKVDTDKRELVADNDAVVIEKANKAGTVFTVKFTAAGEYTLTARAFQSDLFPGTTQSQEIKVVAGFEAESVKQVALNKAEVTFDSNVAGLTKDNFSAYYMISDVKVPFSSVKAVECKDNVATIEFYTDFTQGVEFFVEYDAKAAGSFTAIKVDANSVAAVSIPAQEVVAGSLTDIKYSLLDANGIDITKAALNGTIAFTLVDAATDAFASGTQVYITKVGESYTLTGKYTWYVDGNPKNVEGAGVVTSVAAPVKTLTALTGIITAETEAQKDASKALKNWTMSEAKDVAKLQVNFKYMTGSKEDNENLSETQYSAKSADESIVMLGSKTGCYYPLIANKEGSTTILIYGKDSQGKDIVLGAVPVTVKAARKAASFSVVADKNNINKGYASDAIKFTVKVLDQYDEEMKAAKFAIEQVAGEDYAKVAKVVDQTVGEYVLSVAAVDYSKDGAITLKFTSGDFSQTVGISVANDDDAVIQTLKVSGTALETGVKADTEAKTISVSLAGQTKNGYAAEGKEISFVAKAPVSGTSTGSGVTFVYTVAKDGKLVEAENDNFKANVFTNVVSGAAGTSVSGSAVKLAAGNYVVTAYKVDENGTAKIVSVVGTSSFTVTDNQLKPEFAQNTETVTDFSTATLNKAFTFKFNGAEIAATSFDVQIDGDGVTGNKCYVKSAKIVVANTKGLGSITFDVAIGALLNK